MVLEEPIKEGENPVDEMIQTSWVYNLSSAGHEKPCVNLGGPSSKAKYGWLTDSEQVP
jgi:hypothetical protein